MVLTAEYPIVALRRTRSPPPATSTACLGHQTRDCCPARRSVLMRGRPFDLQ